MIKKMSFLKGFAVIGILLVSMTYILRDMSFVENSLLKDILGIMPNFGVAWVLPFVMCWFLMTVIKKPMKHLPLGLAFTLVILLLSEVVHALFLSSPFDTMDLVATITALLILLVTYFVLHKNLSLD